MSRMLKNIYYPDSSILHATPKAKASYVWKSILHGRDLMKKGLRFVVGKGDCINAWIDPWIPIHPPRPQMAKETISQSLLVKDLIGDHGGWNISKIHQLVQEEDANRILKIKLGKVADKDLLG